MLDIIDGSSNGVQGRLALHEVKGQIQLSIICVQVQEVLSMLSDSIAQRCNIRQKQKGAENAPLRNSTLYLQWIRQRQENFRGHRGTLRALVVILVIDTKVIFSFRKFVFRDVRIDYNLDLKFLVKRQISMIMADLSWGHINIFRGVQEVSAHRVCKELINHNLYLFR